MSHHEKNLADEEVHWVIETDDHAWVYFIVF